MSFIQTHIFFCLFKSTFIILKPIIKGIRSFTLLACSGFTMLAIFPLSDFLFNLDSLQGFELWLEHGAKKKPDSLI